MWPFSSSYPEVSPSTVDGKTYDYVIVGGGTAGCVLASRLSENADVSVLVLEKGHSKDSLLSRIPLVSQNFHFGDKLQVVSDRFSEPSTETSGGNFKLWTAEGLGGASRINAMVMTRGTPSDYNGWAQNMALDDWAWDRVEPYFRKSENHIDRPDSEARGHDGPIKIRQFRSPFVWGSYIEKAAKAIGLPIVEDVNDPTAPAMGFYRLDQAVDERAERNTSYHAYLNESIARKRKSHLTVCTGASASRLKMDDDGGSVRGVLVRPTGKSTGQVYVEARREVIVCCGAFKTAQLLMLSGIGPRDELEHHDIPVVRDLPVGQSLSDHFAFPITIEMPTMETMHMLQTAVYGLWHALLWMFGGTGLMSSNCIPNTIFVRSGAIDDKTMAIREHEPASDGGDGGSGNNMDITQPRNIPDIEVMMFAVSGLKRLVPGHPYFTFYPCLVQPHSNGRVELRDSDPLSHPKVTHPLMRSKEDWPVARKAIRFSMRLAQEFQKSGYPHETPFAFAPGNNLDNLARWESMDPNNDEAFVPSAAPPAATKAPPKQQSPADSVPSTTAAAGNKIWDTVTDDEIDRYIRSMASPSLHPSCSCRMSNDPASGVVDQRLRVHGVRNLRVADTSVFPHMLSSHTMWPAIMVAERCADFLKKDQSK